VRAACGAQQAHSAVPCACLHNLYPAHTGRQQHPATSVSWGSLNLLNYLDHLTFKPHLTLLPLTPYHRQYEKLLDERIKREREEAAAEALAAAPPAKRHAGGAGGRPAHRRPAAGDDDSDEDYDGRSVEVKEEGGGEGRHYADVDIDVGGWAGQHLPACLLLLLCADVGIDVGWCCVWGGGGRCVPA
jgi:hypothetical protein